MTNYRRGKGIVKDRKVCRGLQSGWEQAAQNGGYDRTIRMRPPTYYRTPEQLDWPEKRGGGTKIFLNELVGNDINNSSRLFFAFPTVRFSSRSWFEHQFYRKSCTHLNY